MLPILTLLTLALAVFGVAIPDMLVKRDSPAPLALDFSVTKFGLNSTAAATRRKRSVSAKLTGQQEVAYYVNVELGSNKQTVTLDLDTGSSDLWVFGPKLSISGADGATYNPATSTTSKKLAETFDIEYEDKSQASGNFYTDLFGFSSTTLVNSLQFAVATSVTGISSGIIGIGDKNTEAPVIFDGGSEYVNLPYALQNAGVIPKASYSLYLGSLAGQSGTVLFGGIDTDKYTGTLTSLPIVGSEGLNVEGVSIAVAGSLISVNAPLLLDSGTTLAYVPTAVFNALYDAFDVTTEGLGDNTEYVISCSQPTDEYVTFNFANSVSIKVSYAAAVQKFEDDSTCYFGFEDGGSSDFILGDTFLRSAYIYYDLTDKTISLAQASYSSSSNIISA